MSSMRVGRGAKVRYNPNSLNPPFKKIGVETGSSGSAILIDGDGSGNNAYRRYPWEYEYIVEDD